MMHMPHILFLDVETVSQHPDFSLLNEHGQALWKQKIGFMSRRDDQEWGDEEFASSYKERAAIYAEFGKIIVISAGIISKSEDGSHTLRIKSFCGDDEYSLLQEFASVLQKNFKDPNLHVLCGHNIREFDIPYLCRRMTIHGIPLPALLNIAGKKPWEVKYVCDTLEMWKFGDHKNYTSLDLLAYTLGIASPKENMDGSKVGMAYWEESALDKITHYCEKDVLTVAQVYLRMNNLPLLEEGQVVCVREDKVNVN